MITNELTTRIHHTGESILVPALGDSHSHRVNYQIIVGRGINDNEMFFAKFKKSFWNAEKMISFRVSNFDEWKVSTGNFSFRKEGIYLVYSSGRYPKMVYVSQESERKNCKSIRVFTFFSSLTTDQYSIQYYLPLNQDSTYQHVSKRKCTG